jgi:hypothetical protein
MTREEIIKQWELEFGQKFTEYQRANIYTSIDIVDFAESIVKKDLIAGVVELLPSDGDLDIAAIEFCGDYYPDSNDVTKETEVFDAGAIWMRKEITGQ